ncbi:unnamed protein product [Cyprideis torosa]|uniref:Uncharacterized protein n=1 Tax=Cyprideis torosa TaxID=163714 RepID=A0A7R8ZK37_9CRUS|nr:unnamed protein product [Cyprideis torosa]CAG0883624.1 unnamed protein product [Cyprideis torosa]
MGGIPKAMSAPPSTVLAPKPLKKRYIEDSSKPSCSFTSPPAFLVPQPPRVPASHSPAPGITTNVHSPSLSEDEISRHHACSALLKLANPQKTYPSSVVTVPSRPFPPSSGAPSDDPSVFRPLTPHSLPQPLGTPSFRATTRAPHPGAANTSVDANGNLHALNPFMRMRNAIADKYEDFKNSQKEKEEPLNLSKERIFKTSQQGLINRVVEKLCTEGFTDCSNTYSYAIFRNRLQLGDEKKPSGDGEVEPTGSTPSVSPPAVAQPPQAAGTGDVNSDSGISESSANGEGDGGSTSSRPASSNGGDPSSSGPSGISVIKFGGGENESPPASSKDANVTPSSAPDTSSASQHSSAHPVGSPASLPGSENGIVPSPPSVPSTSVEAQVDDSPSTPPQPLRKGKRKQGNPRPLVQGSRPRKESPSKRARSRKESGQSGDVDTK